MNNEDLRSQYAGMAMQALVSRHARDTFFEEALPGIIDHSVLAADMLIEKLEGGKGGNVGVGGRYWVTITRESRYAWEQVTVDHVRGEIAVVKDSLGKKWPVAANLLRLSLPPKITGI